MASNLIDKLLEETYERARKNHINKKARENIDRADFILRLQKKILKA